LFDNLVQSFKRAAADEKDIRRIQLEEFLMRMFASRLGRYIGQRSFNDLQKGLLDTLPRNVAGDGRIVATLARDLVNLVEINDPALGSLQIILGILDQRQEDVFDILANISCLC
jgi:hypothetical protein